VNDIAHRVQAAAIVPCHYLTDGVGSTLSTLKDAQGWVDAHRDNALMVGTHTQVCSTVPTHRLATTPTRSLSHSLMPACVLALDLARTVTVWRHAHFQQSLCFVLWWCTRVEAAIECLVRLNARPDWVLGLRYFGMFYCCI
jgi:hypothetical protein